MSLRSQRSPPAFNGRTSPPPIADERRYDEGVLYTKSEFLSFYGFNGGVKKWERAMKEPKY